MPFGASPYDLMPSLFPVFFFLIFALVIGTILFSLVKGIRTWNYNNSQPILTVPAKVVARRADVSSSMNDVAGSNGMQHQYHTHTTHFLTFEVESGDRMEFQVNDNDFGMIVEGDVGKVTFQGTRYLGFARENKTGF
ncbi:hypothetical protein CEB3_c22260 [Peptococcaceae bacterium CEB3]|nr:hypothetical protein CEB3_c22260 [Peptococcaceae bacterium CEB3]